MCYTIFSATNLIEGYGKANTMFPGRTKFLIDNALISNISQRNRLSFKKYTS